MTFLFSLQEWCIVIDFAALWCLCWRWKTIHKTSPDSLPSSSPSYLFCLLRLCSCKQDQQSIILPSLNVHRNLYRTGIEKPQYKIHYSLISDCPYSGIPITLILNIAKLLQQRIIWTQVVLTYTSLSAFNNHRNESLFLQKAKAGLPLYISWLIFIRLHIIFSHIHRRIHRSIQLKKYYCIIFTCAALITK